MQICFQTFIVHAKVMSQRMCYKEVENVRHPNNMILRTSIKNIWQVELIIICTVSMFNIELLCLYSQINYAFMIIDEKVLHIRKWFTDRPFNRDLEEE